MITLVAGASGATGKHLVEQLLNMGQNVKVIVRPSSEIPDTWDNNDKVSIIRSDKRLSEGCLLSWTQPDLEGYLWKTEKTGYECC